MGVNCVVIKIGEWGVVSGSFGGCIRGIGLGGSGDKRKE